MIAGVWMLYVSTRSRNTWANITPYRKPLLPCKDDRIYYVVSSINRILSQCFLDVSTSNLRKAILSILNMCLHFSNFFVTFVGETTATHDVSRQTISVRRHRIALEPLMQSDM